MTRRRLFLAFIAGLGALPGLTIAGLSQPATPTPVPGAARPQQDPALRAAIEKSNAYIGLMNRTLRASESWARYTSWVNLKTGPTGKERYIVYGLYSLYDVRSEIEKAAAATLAEPKVPELDARVLSYIEAYKVLAPLITQASGYYERKDYLSDKAAEGKALHAKMVPAAEAFLAERAMLEALMRDFSHEITKRELAALEASEGRKGRWHVKNNLIGARAIMDLLPSNAKPVVDMKAFDAAVTDFAGRVREFALYAQSNPDDSSNAERFSSFLGKIREFQQKLARAKGDARRGAGNDLTWIVNDYNMIITFAR
jgi:hypothetical protein